MIATQGGRFNGWGLYLLAGKPTFHYNLVGVQRTTVADQNKLAPGKHTIVVDFKYDGPASARAGQEAASDWASPDYNWKLFFGFP